MSASSLTSAGGKSAACVWCATHHGHETSVRTHPGREYSLNSPNLTTSFLSFFCFFLPAVISVSSFCHTA
uniref:Alternative protein REG3A n=1 Tax=Homo sapiens TaxID=9606 RepID=L8E7R5_HUMAN|nr:alternative protein REG3A [Homo sapiens]